MKPEFDVIISGCGPSGSLLGYLLSGEGLFNAFRSSHLALGSIKKALASPDYSFNDYAEAVQQEIYSDIKLSLIFSRIFFAYPMFFYKLLKSNDKFFKLCCQVLRGDKKYSHISGKLDLSSN
jgi:flavin-dependent dehydrogenase